jgi:excisionase family DNA binding protein
MSRKTLKYCELKGVEMGEKKIQAKMLTKPEVADHFRVTVRAIEIWMKTGGMPFYKIGSLVRFNMDEVLKWKSERKCNG